MLIKKQLKYLRVREKKTIQQQILLLQQDLALYHIPVDPIAASGKELINKVKAPLTKVLKQDFHDTISGQMNDFSSIARQSIRRLEKNNSKYCENKDTKSSLTEESTKRKSNNHEAQICIYNNQ